ATAAPNTRTRGTTLHATARPRVCPTGSLTCVAAVLHREPLEPQLVELAVQRRRRQVEQLRRLLAVAVAAQQRRGDVFALEALDRVLQAHQRRRGSRFGRGRRRN